MNKYIEKQKKINLLANAEPWMTILMIFFIGLSSFGLGRFSVSKSNEPVTIEYGSINKDTENEKVIQSNNVFNEFNKIVASKNGAKYYYQNCSGVSKIKNENKIFFTSEKEAESGGYSLAANCLK